MSLIIGVPEETYPDERRVALIPAALPPLVNSGMEIQVQAGAGQSAGFPDAAYQEKGARVVATRTELFQNAGVVVQVRGYGANPEAGKADLELLRAGQVLVGFHEPLGQPECAQELAHRQAVTFALELLPRISRAQSMDALSSMATVLGYKAVLLAAAKLPRLFPMMMTAAGMIQPAQVFVIGAGVAGLQAIATARKLGAVVQAYDVRPACRDEVQSLGAKFVELPLETDDAEDTGGYARAMDEQFYRTQREVMAKVVGASNVVVCTAIVPGQKAPVLITREMVHAMSPGAVIVDLAAEQGGNCEVTRPGEDIVEEGVHVLGPVNLVSTVPDHASQMYAKNISNLLLHLVADGSLKMDLEDEITRETLLTREGEVVHARVRKALGLETAATDRQEKS